MRNQTPLESITIQSKTVLGKAEPTTLVFEPIAAEQAGEASSLSVEQNNRIQAVDLCDTSLAQSFSSSTEITEKGLAEIEKSRRTDPQLLKAIPGPDLSSVLSFWGEEARDQLANILKENDDLFMKHKADIGSCKIAKTALT